MIVAPFGGRRPLESQGLGYLADRVILVASVGKPRCYYSFRRQRRKSLIIKECLDPFGFAQGKTFARHDSVIREMGF